MVIFKDRSGFYSLRKHLSQNEGHEWVGRCLAEECSKQREQPVLRSEHCQMGCWMQMCRFQAAASFILVSTEVLACPPARPAYQSQGNLCSPRQDKLSTATLNTQRFSSCSHLILKWVVLYRTLSDGKSRTQAASTLQFQHLKYAIPGKVTVWKWSFS